MGTTLSDWAAVSDVKTSAMLRLAAQVVQSLGTMRDTKVHWTADAKVFDSSAIPSFFEIKEAGGVCALSEKNRIVGF
jgi:hypothetical protein